MKLPDLQNPEQYAGLYVFDFGDGQVAVGYTADEVAVLLESEKYREGKVYRIHRGLPDGTLELVGVSRRMFELEDGLFFYTGSEAGWRADFEGLCRLAEQTPPPCRLKVHQAHLGEARYPYVTAVLFPAEFTHEVADWLLKAGFSGGELVEGGPSQVTGYYQAGATVVERRQFLPAGSNSRPADEVLATTHLTVQRVPA